MFTSFYFFVSAFPPQKKKFSFSVFQLLRKKYIFLPLIFSSFSISSFRLLRKIYFVSRGSLWGLRSCSRLNRRSPQRARQDNSFHILLITLLCHFVATIIVIVIVSMGMGKPPESTLERVPETGSQLVPLQARVLQKLLHRKT